MGLDSTTGNTTLSRFLEAWPVTSLRNMSIEEYADLGDHNAYCYWLEYGSRDLGEVGGIPLTKFGLWKYKIRKDYDEAYESDSTYAWDGKFGKARMQAYKKIIATVAEIAEAAARSDWQYIEEIEFHAIAKWKIAFMYSNKQLIPIYTREGLLKVALGLGGRFLEATAIANLQLFIRDKKPVEKDMIEFAENMWAYYVKGKSFRNYFIVGSKFNSTEDIFPIMLSTNSIAIGFLHNYDLSKLLDSPIEEINAFIQQHSKDEEIDISKLQSYFRILLHLKPGDIIAVKSHGSYGTLTIIAYAVVTEKNGKVYEYKPEILGHHINVEFVELDINRKTNLNYAGTIHHVSSNKPDHLKQIFGPFLQVDDIALGDENDDSYLAGSYNHKYKSEESYQRGEIAWRMVRQLHNIIQNSFYKKLEKEYPRHSLRIEYEGRVDIVRETDTERWFYEIKPFENIISCLREATGQLIEYSFRFQNTDKKTNLVIVGPGELTGEAIGFLDHFKESINLPLSYQQHVVPLRQD
jgi:hypothetical protein